MSWLVCSGSIVCTISPRQCTPPRWRRILAIYFLLCPRCIHTSRANLEKGRRQLNNRSQTLHIDKISALKKIRAESHATNFNASASWDRTSVRADSGHVVLFCTEKCWVWSWTSAACLSAVQHWNHGKEMHRSTHFKVYDNAIVFTRSISMLLFITWTDARRGQNFCHSQWAQESWLDRIRIKIEQCPLGKKKNIK